MISRLALTLAVAAPWSSTAFAQVDPMNMMREAAANQVGVMEYCTKQGYTDVAAVTAQRAALGQLPAGTADTSKAEELGRGGIISMNGTSTSLADFATQTHTTVPDLCKQMAAVALQTAAMSAGTPAMPGLSGMPGMPSGMPSMPSGMPSMPSGIPGMPGAAPSKR